MDTRIKIIDAGQAMLIAASGATTVSGYFDPMTADLAERLAGFKRPGAPLLVLIRGLENEILPPRARAELVAALAAVDYVCETAIGDQIVPQIQLELEHADALKRLIRHVHTRQQAAS